MKRVVVCPYCNRPSPEPDQIGMTKSCHCGAVFAALEEEELGSGILRLVNGLYQDATAPVEELLEECQVTVFEFAFDQEQSDICSGLAEFIKEVRFESWAEEAVDLNLVWVVRGEAPTKDQSQVIKFESLEN